MNIWQHCLLSVKKFGGVPKDYLAVHRFMDSSKLFYYHVKHRLLLHNLWGVELCTQYLGDILQNSENKIIPIRDIAVEHCREDLSGKIPTLYDWLSTTERSTFIESIEVPDFQNDTLNQFAWQPYLRTNLKEATAITCSDFGVYLVEKFWGTQKAQIFAQQLNPQWKINVFLENIQFKQKWQYTPNTQDLDWLKKHGTD